MIIKLSGFKNKYQLTESSNSRDLIDLIDKYGKFRCIICNKETALRFRPRDYVTVNNSIEDNMFFINGVF